MQEKQKIREVGSGDEMPETGYGMMNIEAGTVWLKLLVRQFNSLTIQRFHLTDNLIFHRLYLLKNRAKSRNTSYF